MTVLFILLVVIALAVILMASGKKQNKKRDHLRGQQLATGDQVSELIQRQKLPTRLEIGGVPIPISVEDRGFLLAGSQGTGKSQAVTRILDGLRAAGHRVIVSDPSGIFYSRYAQPGDSLLNPFDRRSVKWSPLSEIREIEDCAALAKSVIPDGVGAESSWNDAAQAVLEGILRYCWQNKLTNSDLFNLACISSADELQQLLAGTPAMTVVGNARYFGEVRPGLGRHLRAFEYLDPDAGVGDFSIRSFIENGGGSLFIVYKQTQRDALRPNIQCALDVASRAVLDLPPAAADRSQQRRTWFVLDELPLLGRISSLVTLLTNGSKHGSAVIAGIQSVAQLREVYGHDQAQTILATLGTWLTLRVPDAETSEYMSKALGDAEIRRVVQSGGESHGKRGGGKNQANNWQEQYSMQRVVMAAELQNLPDLCGYLNIAGPLPACPVRLPFAARRAPAAEPFVQAERKPRQPAQPAAQAAADEAEASDLDPDEIPEFSLDK